MKIPYILIIGIGIQGGRTRGFLARAPQGKSKFTQQVLGAASAASCSPGIKGLKRGLKVVLYGRGHRLGEPFVRWLGFGKATGRRGWTTLYGILLAGWDLGSA